MLSPAAPGLRDLSSSSPIPTMSASLRLTSIQLRVAQLPRSVEFYTRQLGFVALDSSPTRADLATAPGGPVILTLLGAPDATPAPRDAAGLFHAALLLPSRPALGAWLQSAAQSGTEFEGFSDHGVSDAIYLRDPEGNGLEFYADRPRTEWPYSASGELAMITARLDIPGLLAQAAPASATPLAGAGWGHLHLRVTNLDRSDAFYRAQLGLSVTQGSVPGARFLAADGYHHHLGLNTWGHPNTPRPPSARGLVEATFTGPALVTQTFTDPDGITLRLVAA
jgi:catechol 2,3-dioxygenase